ncbi:MazG-like family protein [Kitasatospora sp. NPDC051853]|uniref:MazG-like family protein n=1 Tax=Kitasatospora sp. NPDC051853 TaxID=3364058 RepID=UPI0037916D11
MDDAWTTVKSLSAHLSSLSELTPREAALAQALKLGEESGELAEAVIGMYGLNPRKGVSHTLADVHAEACDAAVTAFVLIERTGGDARAAFEQHLRKLASRTLPTAPGASG